MHCTADFRGEYATETLCDICFKFGNKRSKTMKRKQKLFIGITVIAITVIFTIAGCASMKDFFTLAEFPSDFTGTWERADQSEYTNTITFTSEAVKDSNQKNYWYVRGVSGDVYTMETFNDNSALSSHNRISIKLKNGNLEIVADDSVGKQWQSTDTDYTGTWKKIDSESDFMVERRGNGLTIIDYLGKKNEVHIPTRIQNLPVTGIADYAFIRRARITSITIPNYVTSIGERAFNECYSLISVTMPNSLTKIGEGAFFNCESLTYITIPDSVTSIGELAFNGCESLTSIVIPNGVTSIGRSVFDSCESLTNITIPNSVTSIGHRAFGGCTSLASVTLPNSVTSIEGFAFNNCESLTSITIPASVTSIGGSAFSICTSLTEINVAAGNNAFTSENGILYSKDKTSLRSYPAGKTGNSFTIPNSVIDIGWGAFQGSTSLTSVIIPASVTSIGNNAFSNCEKLTSVTFQGVINKDNFSDNRQDGQFNYFYNPFPGDLRAKFYATDAINGTRGTYTRPDGSNTWTKQ